MYFLQDRKTEAKEHLRKALEAQAFWEYGKHVAMAEILIEDGELERAEELLLQAREKFGPQAAEDPGGADRVQKLIERVRELRGSASPGPGRLDASGPHSGPAGAAAPPG